MTDELTKRKIYRVSELYERVKKERDENYEKYMKLIIASGLLYETIPGTRMLKLYPPDRTQPPYDVWPAKNRWYSRSLSKSVEGIEGLLKTLTRSRLNYG